MCTTDIINIDEIIDRLYELPVINRAFEVKCNNKNDKIGYQCLIKCNVTVDANDIALIVGVPRNWKTLAVDVYLFDHCIDDLPLLPHVGKEGKVCYADPDATLLDTSNLAGLIVECVSRSVKIIQEGFEGKNAQDFVSEFNAYWSLLPNVVQAIVDIENAADVSSIKYLHESRGSIGAANRKTRRKNGIRSRKAPADSKTPIVVGLNENDLEKWSDRHDSKALTGVFFHIHPSEQVFPPDFKSGLPAAYVEHLLSYIVVDDALLALRRSAKSPLILFEIVEPDGTVVSLGINFTRGTVVKSEDGKHLVLSKSARFVPVVVERVDRQSLMGRVTLDNEARLTHGGGLAKKSCLLVGCGSIGGFVADMLARAGCDDLGLVDNDILRSDNIFRHLLGKRFIGRSKVEGLQSYLTSQIPDIQIQCWPYRFEALIDSNPLAISAPDYLISATGSHTINLAIDRYLLENHLHVDAFFVWNEPYDIGCHAVYIPGTAYEADSASSTYASLFGYRGGALTCLVDYCASGQRFTRDEMVCGSAYVPYGMDVSVKSALLVTELVRKVADGRLCEGVIVSEKGDGFYFQKAGFDTSDTYALQKEVRKTESLAECQAICSDSDTA